MKHFFFALLLLSSGAQAADALYTVPVPDDRADLLKVSQMFATNVRFREKKSAIELEYRLPALLTGGDAKEIRLTGARIGDTPHISVTGPEAFGTCEADESLTYSCSLNYVMDDLNIDPLRTQDYIKRTSPAAEIAARTELAGVFIDEARGVLSGLKLKAKHD